MYRGGQLRDISEVSEVGVTIIPQFRHLGLFTHPLSSSPSVDHGSTYGGTSLSMLIVCFMVVMVWKMVCPVL